MPFNTSNDKFKLSINNGSVINVDGFNLLEGNEIQLDLNYNSLDKETDIEISAYTYTAEDAQDAVGSILTDSSTIDFTYDDATPSITASVIQTALDHTNLLSIGSNSHLTIDNHIADNNNIHLTIENIQDSLANSFINTSTPIITTTYNDSLNTLTFGVDESELYQLNLNNFDNSLQPSKGGTGVTTTPSNGQLLIGNGVDYSLNTLSAGANITITNNPGSITIDSTSFGPGAQSWSWGKGHIDNPLFTLSVTGTNTVAIGNGNGIIGGNNSFFIGNLTNTTYTLDNSFGILANSSGFQSTSINSPVSGSDSVSISSQGTTSGVNCIAINSNSILGSGCVESLTLSQTTTATPTITNSLNNTLINCSITQNLNNKKFTILMSPLLNVGTNYSNEDFNFCINQDKDNTNRKILNTSLSLIPNIHSRVNTFSLSSGLNTKYLSQKYPLKGICQANNTVVLTSNGLSPSFWTNIPAVVYNQSGWFFYGKIIGIDSVTNDINSYKISGAYRRPGSGNGTLIYSNVTVLQEDDASWGVTLSQGTGDTILRITATGDVSNITYWSGYIKIIGASNTQVI